MTQRTGRGGGMMNEKIDIPVWEKYTLTIEEASRYFTIGQNKLRRLVEENRHGDWYVMNGNRILIKKNSLRNLWIKQTQSNAKEPCM